MRYSITARWPAATIAASSSRCRAPRVVTASGNSASPLAHQGHVLHLDIAGRPVRRFEQEIDPRGLPVFHLAPHRCVAGELFDGAGGERMAGDHVRMRGVDADEFQPGAEVDFDELPRIGQLATGLVGAREKHPRARRSQSSHGAGIGDMGGDLLAARKHRVGEKALVAAHQCRGN